MQLEQVRNLRPRVSSSFLQKPHCLDCEFSSCIDRFGLFELEEEEGVAEDEVEAEVEGAMMVLWDQIGLGMG